MWNKFSAGAALGAALVFGAAFVSKSTSYPGRSSSSDSGSEAFAVISHGESVALADHADPGGKYTVFLFGADW